MGVAGVTWPTGNFIILGPLNNVWTNWPISFKFGTETDDAPRLRMENKTTSKWTYCGGVYCNRSCLWVCDSGRAVSEPYYSQRARSVCVSLSAFFIVVVVVDCLKTAELITNCRLSSPSFQFYRASACCSVQIAVLIWHLCPPVCPMLILCRSPVCVFVCLWRAGGVCYHDNSKLRASIFTKLGL